VNVADRVAALPPYLFARIEKKIDAARAAGVDVISLGIGDPDQSTPEHIIEALTSAAHNPENHRYPSSEGMLAYRRAVAGWYHKRFGVELDPASEVISLLGSKEGIAHIAFCYLQAGDYALVPDPGYPVYSIGAALAGADVYNMPLSAVGGFIPDLSAIPSEVARKARLMFINYPNNPTGATVDGSFYREVVEFAREYDILVCHDAAYSEITFDGYVAPSFLQIPGAKEVGIEFHSLSKTYNMTGWRIGWAAGQPDVIKTLGALKSNLDSGVFQAVQYAGIAALEGPQECVRQVCAIYQERRYIAAQGLRSLGWNPDLPVGSFYMWVPVPAGYNSTDFAEVVLERSGVVITPGIGYGKCGEGYFRIALTLKKERITEAFTRIKRAFGSFKKR
jgi:LL-diaminopimelate aminotransferase